MFRRRRGYRRVQTTLYEAHVSGANHESDTEIRGRYASEISSSLSLQILIYYNGLLSAIYLFLEGSLIVNKVGTLKEKCTILKHLVQSLEQQLMLGISVWYYSRAITLYEICIPCIRRSTAISSTRRYRWKPWELSSWLGHLPKCCESTWATRVTSRRWCVCPKCNTTRDRGLDYVRYRSPVSVQVKQYITTFNHHI